MVTEPISKRFSDISYSCRRSCNLRSLCSYADCEESTLKKSDTTFSVTVSIFSRYSRLASSYLIGSVFFCHFSELKALNGCE